MTHIMTMKLFEDDPGGGTEVEIEFIIANADPDVGIERSYAEEWWIVGNDEKTLALQKRLSADTAEDERVGVYIHENYVGLDSDYYDY